MVSGLVTCLKKSLFPKRQTELFHVEICLKCGFAFQDLVLFPVDVVYEQSLTVHFKSHNIYPQYKEHSPETDYLCLRVWTQPVKLQYSRL